MNYSNSPIMVVDDNPINLKVIEETLNPLGVIIHKAKSAKDCIDLLGNIDPVLFILDIMMPEIDGFELFSMIRGIERFSKTPIMFISALNDPESEGKGIALGAVDFITKPIAPGLVRSRVDNILKLQGYQYSLEARAKLKEEQFRELFINSPIPQFLISFPTLEIKEANLAAEKLFGYSIDKLCSLTPLDLSPSFQKGGISSYDYGISCYNRSLSGEIDSFEWIHIDKDKKDIISEVRIMQFPGEEDVFVASVIDVTERRMSERYVQSIMDSMPFSLIGITGDFKISHWNKFISEISSLSFDEVQDRDLFNVLPQLKLERDLIKSTIEDNKFNRVEKRERVTRDGTVFESIVIFPLENESQGAVILIEDITKDITLRNKVVQSEKMMPVSDMIAGIIHEVTNPLAGVIQNSQSMEKRLRGSIPANIVCAEKNNIDLNSLGNYLQERKIFDMLHSIRESGKKATQIVKNLQTFIRDDSGTQAKCSVESIIEQALEIAESDFNILNKVDFKTIERVINLEDIPEIKCDSSKILQVFTNIFMFCERNIALSDINGKIEITGSVDQGYLKIWIKDNGLQISSDELELVKKPSYDNRKRGYWYYLSMVVFIVEEIHRGKFRVSSNAFGNICEISLPL